MVRRDSREIGGLSRRLCQPPDYFIFWRSRCSELLRVAVDIRRDRDGRVRRGGTIHDRMNDPAIFSQNKLRLDHGPRSTARGIGKLIVKLPVQSECTV
jgi:hypothetical protein